MSYEFRPAVRDKTSVLIALAGSSGSGKTYTAILLAFGLAYSGMSNVEILAAIEQEGRSRVVFIDTEGGRGKHYAPGPGSQSDFVDTFPYAYAEIRAPYTPEAYQEAMMAADAAGFGVIIVDSLSHEFESEGGICEIADKLEAGVLKPGKTLADAEDPQNGWKCWAIKPVKSPGNWSEPKTRHKTMVNRAVQLRAHIIFCLRAEEKMLLRRVKKQTSQGKDYYATEVVPAEERPLLERWVPICEKRFMYETTVSFLLLPTEAGVGYPLKKLQRKFIPMFPEGQLIGRHNGELLAAWSTGRDPGARTPERAQSPASDAPRDVQREPTRSESPATDQRTDSGPLDKRAQREAQVDAYEAGLAKCRTRDELGDYQNDQTRLRWFATIRDSYPDLHERVVAIDRVQLRRIEDAEATAED